MRVTPVLRLYVSLVLVLMGTIAHAQRFHYVVIGSFAHENHAERFVRRAEIKNVSAQYDLRADVELYYVYVLKTGDQQQAADLARALKKDSEFRESWVYYGQLEKDRIAGMTVTASLDKAPAPDLAPPAVVAVPVEPVAAADVAEDGEDMRRYVVVDSATAKTIPASALGSVKLRGKLFKFVVTGVDGRPMPATIHYVNYDQGRELASYPVNQYVDILPPLSIRQQPMTLVCGIFGYKEAVQNVNFAAPGLTPKANITKDEHGAWVVPYRLIPLGKGDVSIMHHVGFYKNAAVMMPLSKVELDQLVKMMSDNPRYEIKIHGHANDNFGRNIVGPGNSKNYFEMKGAVKYDGSVKELSRMRAEAVRQYLTDHGISKDRIAVRAWGNQEILVDEMSRGARMNDRVEIEVVRD